MISNRFKEQTINNGEIMSLDLSINPKDFGIFIPEGYDSEELPLMAIYYFTERKGKCN